MEQQKPAAKTQDEQLILFSKHKKLIKTCMEILPSDYSFFQISRFAFIIIIVGVIRINLIEFQANFALFYAF
jgi:hypothetical protein